MAFRVVYLMLLTSFVCCEPEYVRKKICKDVDQNQCDVYSVVVDPCDQGPAFCSVKQNKKYALTLNLKPKFSAHKLKLSINGDVANDDKYSTVILAPQDGCDYLTCPLQAEERRIFDVDFILDKRASVGIDRDMFWQSKFPVKVKLWNEENESQACCFTFNVKVK